MDQKITQLSQKIFAIDTARDLASGYERSEDVTAQITETLALSETELISRLNIKKSTESGFLKGETLIFLMTEARALGNENLVNDLARRLGEICQYLVGRWTFFENNFDRREDLVSEVIAEMIRQVLTRDQKSYDFWEVNFFQTLKRLTFTIYNKQRLARSVTDVFSELTDEDGERQIFEDTLEDVKRIDAGLLHEMKDLLERLTKNEREVFVLYNHSGYKQDEIAQILGVTDKTVRNRLRSAENSLQQIMAANKGALNG